MSTQHVQLYMSYREDDLLFSAIKKNPNVLMSTSMELSVAQYAVVFKLQHIIDYIARCMPSTFLVMGALCTPPIVLAAQRNYFDIVEQIDKATRIAVNTLMRSVSKDSSVLSYKAHYPLIQRILGVECGNVQITLNYYLDTYADLTNKRTVDPAIFKQLEVFGASVERYIEARPKIPAYRLHYIRQFFEFRKSKFSVEDTQASLWYYMYLSLEVPYIHGLTADDIDHQ